jgi:hypothetical protein
VSRYQDNNDPAASLQAFTDFPAASTITITRNGSSVTSDPDYKTPPHFRWDAGEFGYQETRGNATTMNFTVGGVSFYAETSSIVPWTSGTSGFGPAGALDSLPLPLHWFVHSLSASVTAYSFIGGGKTVEGLAGRAHMEKNWGREFPDRWMWAEARDGSDGGVTGGVSFAFSGGDLVLWGEALPMNMSHLAGYRNSNKQLSWDFTPVDSRLNASIDACKGLFSFDLLHNILPHRLSVSALVPVPSLRTCLWGPAQSGFAPMSTESFLATIEITARTRRFDHDEVLDTVVMRHAAVEFGGAYRCMQPDPCAQPLE